MTRVEALERAAAMVERLSPVNNARGYPDGAQAALAGRVAAILRIADWLCPEEPDTHELRTWKGQVLSEIAEARADAKRALEEL